MRKLEISESQRNRIQAMLARGLSRYRISKETGIGKYHLRKILKESNAVSVRRCPQCGRMVSMPCLACAVETEKPIPFRGHHENQPQTPRYFYLFAQKLILTAAIGEA